eukprot:m.71270 g.71270  ORF g.71270 m.71270 type:complete len:522 (+) comp14203_c0_seq1:130-1695(+)
MSLFGGGVPQTPLTMAIDKATSEDHPSEDLSLHLEICDMVNETQSGSKDAAKCLKKKLTPKSSSPVQLKSLIVLETCAKNCGKRFHLQVTTKDFVNTLVKLLNQRDLATVVRDKLLTIIQSWGESFRSDPAMTAIVQTYQELRLKRVEFPAQDLDAMAPIMTPAVNEEVIAQRQQSHSASDSTSQPSAAGLSDEDYARQLSQELNAGPPPGTSRSHPGASPANDGYVMRTQPLQLAEGQSIAASPEQQAKIRKDLEIVTNNATMLTDMLQALEEGQTVRESDIIGDLHVACQQMQRRVMTLVSQLNNEDLMAELLLANDLLGTALQFYNECLERDARNNPDAATGTEFSAEPGLLVDLSDSTPASQSGYAASTSSADPFANPIISAHDPFADPPIQSQLAGLNLGPAPGESTTDSHQPHYSTQAAQPPPSYAANAASRYTPAYNSASNPPPTQRLNSNSQMDEPVEMASSSLLSKLQPAEGNLIDLGEPEAAAPGPAVPVTSLSEDQRQRMEDQHDDLFEL